MVRASPKIEILETSDGLWLIAGPSRARLTRVSKQVVRIDIEGHAHAAFAPILIEYLASAVEEADHVFLGVDGEGMRSYDSRFRYLWTEWFKREVSAIDGVMVLFKSRAVLTGTVIVNAVTGRRLIDACSEREPFERKLAELATAQKALRL